MIKGLRSKQKNFKRVFYRSRTGDEGVMSATRVVLVSFSCYWPDPLIPSSFSPSHILSLYRGPGLLIINGKPQLLRRNLFPSWTRPQNGEKRGNRGVELASSRPPLFPHLLKARRRSPPWRGGAIGRYTSSKSLFQFLICNYQLFQHVQWVTFPLPSRPRGAR